MTRIARRFDDTISNTPFDTAIESLAGVMLFVLPLAFGGTQAWSREIWFALASLMGLALLLKLCVYRDCRTVWSWAYLPIVLFLALVVVQLLPLSAGLLSAISPATLQVRADLLHDLGGHRGAATTISLYPYATLEQARMVAAVATVFVVVLHVYRAPSRLRRLLVSIVLAGLAVAGVALYHDLTRATLIYGLVPIGHRNAGPFQNYSHFSQFMNLSIGAAVALLLWAYRDWTAGGAGIDYVRSELRQSRNWPVWAALTLCVLGPVLVFWSMSRMGTLSMCVAGVVTAGLWGWRGGPARRGSRRSVAGGVFWMICLGLAGLTLLVGIGFDAIAARLSTVGNVDAVAGARWQILSDLTQLFAKFPLLGSGLGTHEFVFPMVSNLDFPALATHAENEYAQLLAECGAIGLALAAGFVAVVAWACAKSIWRPRLAQQAVAFGLGFGLIAIGIHSFSDFGQHVPANATLTAMFSAVLISTASLVRSSSASTAPAPAVARPAGIAWLRYATAGLAFVGFGWIIWQADIARRAEAARTTSIDLASSLEANGWRGDDDAYRDLLTHAARAAELEPGNAVYRYWLNTYRWQLVNQTLADLPAEADRDVVRGFATQIVDELDGVRQLCPTYGPPLAVAGQIRATLLGQAELGERQLQDAYRLAPYSRTAAYLYGLTALRKEELRAADEAFARYLRLGGARWHVVDVYLLVARPDLAYETAKDHPRDLRRLAAGLAASWPGETDLLAECYQRLDAMTVAASERDGADPADLFARGRLEFGKGNQAAAIEWCQKAVNQDYANTDWRLHLARYQAAAGKNEEAAQNLRLCLRLRPKLAEAERLLADMSRRRTPSNVGQDEP